jgi:hypothetical protein
VLVIIVLSAKRRLISECTGVEQEVCQAAYLLGFYKNLLENNCLYGKQSALYNP